jgi:hypothetical protein
MDVYMKYFYSNINREIVCGIASEENDFITVEGAITVNNK